MRLRGCGCRARQEEWLATKGLVATDARCQKPVSERWADVDQHAEALHLGDRLEAEGRQSAAGVLLTDPVGHHRAAVPGHRGDPDAEAVEGVEQLEGVAHRLTALEGEDERDAAALDRGPDLVAPLADRHVGGVHVGQAAGLLEHLQAPAQRALPHVLLLGEDREHLEGHAAGPQLW